MLAENVSLGVLALPQALAVLGIVPGLLCIFFLGIIATYTGWIIGEFKLAHPSVQSFADCGMLTGGPILRDIFALAQVLILIFIQGAHVLSFSIAMNAITDHAMCTIWWTVIGMILCLVLGLPRTFKNISYLSIFCTSNALGVPCNTLTETACLSIVFAVTAAMVAIGIQKPDVGNILVVRPNVLLVKGLGPVLNIILAYSKFNDLEQLQSELKLKMRSRSRRLLLLPGRAQGSPRLQKGPFLRTRHRSHFLYDHLHRHLLQEGCMYGLISTFLHGL
jgi:hypothetical protein